MKTSGKRTGIFGGTFNPPHFGHLIVADHAAHELALDRIIFVPSFISPHKRAGEEHAAEHRMEMVRLAVTGHRSFEVSDLELKRPGASYTIDTLLELHSLYPDDLFFLLLGADNVAEFHTWKSHEKIPALATVVAMNRPGYRAPEELPAISGMLTVEVPNIQISSSDIRRRLIEGRDIRYFIPDAILKYIQQTRLYDS
ncbi:MAG: nicotinate-nucleotide adenylyltransferase [Ignavibacteriales bacterium]|nr:nicotinate-nucleotide adenylyltransferase [Ignavibacteriales bacterium]